MRLPEQKLWDRLSNNVGRQHGILLMRVEALFTPGLPDVFCQSKAYGVACWIELKVAARWPVRTTSAVLNESNGLRLDQKNWHIDHTNFGGRSFVLIGVDGTDEYALIPGRYADKINGATTQELVDMGEVGFGKQFWKDMRIWIS